MPNRKDSTQGPGPGDAGQHNDWGQRQADEGGNAQSGAGGNVGGVPGGQHNDWGHSEVDDAGDGQASRAAGRKRQGVMPGEEMGRLQNRKKR